MPSPDVECVLNTDSNRVSTNHPATLFESQRANITNVEQSTLYIWNVVKHFRTLLVP